MSSNFKLPLCICCGGSTVDYNYRDSFLDNPLCRCEKCEHVQIREIPPESVICDYYRNGYSVQRGRSLGTAYETLMIKRAVAQVEYIQRYMLLSGASIVDIGCGFGHFLLSVSKITDNINGYDYDPLAVDFCKAKGLLVEHLESENGISDIFCADLCVLSHCLEHFAYPGATLRSLGKKCRQIFIEVPIYDSDILGQFLDQEGHMNFFNKNSLRIFLQKNGFDILDITVCGPSIRLFYINRWRAIRQLLQTISNDYFINQYRVRRPTGMWARAMIRYGGSRESH